MALDCLLRGYGELTLGQIAARLGVSAKTIHRELTRIAPALSQNYGLVLSAKSGQGLRVLGSPERIEACLGDLAEARARERSPEERKRLLVALLLEAGDVVKLLSLEADLGSGIVAVRRDLEEMRSWLEGNGLALSLRRGIGVTLEGPEWGRRQAISSLVMEQFGEAGLLGLINDETTPDETLDPVADILLRMVPAQGFRAAEAVLSGLPRDCALALAPRDYLGLVTHLAVGAERRRRGFPLGEIAGTPLEEAASTKESRAATLIAEGMASASGLEGERAETLSVESYLRGAKPERSGGPGLGEIDMAALAGLKALIQACEELYDASFVEDRVLRDGLASHWAPALYRIRNRLPIRNPLLQQIRTEYVGLFAAIRKASDRVFPELRVPDDEVGYLVLHFGSSLERRAKTGQRFRALVVCSAGIGSAHMLASRIRAELPEIDIVASLSWFDIDDRSRDTWDILVSTIRLPLPESDYILVSPLLSEDGIRALRGYMDRRRHLIRAADVSAADESADRNGARASLQDLKQMSGHLSAAIGILEGFRVFGPAPQGAEAGSARPGQAWWEDLLAESIERCAGAGLLADPAAALRDLELRSRDRGMVLPGSAILFLHARTSGLARPSLSLHVLSGTPSAEGAAWAAQPTMLVLMLAPPGLDSPDQDILNEISSSFLDPRTVEVLETGDESEIRTHYSRHLDRYARSLSQQGA